MAAYQNAFNLQLAQRTHLNPLAAWQAVTNPATLANGQWRLTLPMVAAPGQFFRLQPK